MTINIDYKTWKTIITKRISPVKIIEEIKIANLCGRYGTNISTSLSIVANNNAPQKYILGNADESEPGTFKDKHIMLTKPHQLIEGMAILGYVTGATKGYIYVRGEFLEPMAKLEGALKEAYKAKFLGKNIFNSAFNFDLYVVHGAGSYICGEETAMIESIEGKKGFPRFKPPYPTTVGLYGCPTAIYNIEVLIQIPILLKSNIYSKSPSPQSGEGWGEVNGDTSWNNCKIFSVSGHVNKPGTYELPLGSPFKDLLAMVGGMKNNKKLKAVLPGGLSSPVIPANLIMQLNLDYQSLFQVGSMLGSCGLIVMDETTSMVEVLLKITKFYMNESCGQCSPCREGTGWAYRIVNRVSQGKASLQDLEVLDSVASNMENNTICGLGQMVSKSVKSFIKHFRQEFVDAIMI